MADKLIEGILAVIGIGAAILFVSQNQSSSGQNFTVAAAKSSCGCGLK